MNKAFIRETAADEDEETAATAPPQGGKNYITAAGCARLRAELLHLLDHERPQVVETVSWAAKNGDRSENGDYLYGKKRLREIDRRIRHLSQRLDVAVVVDPSVHHGKDQVFFGARVVYIRCRQTAAEPERVLTIMGIDEADKDQGHISWISPMAEAMLKARVGDVVRVRTPTGVEEIEILQVDYPAPASTA